MKKYGYWLLCSVGLLAILLLCFFKTEIYAENKYPLEFFIEQDAHNAKIAIHESEDGIYYVFLPSYTDLSALKIVKSGDSEVSLGGTAITGGMRCEDFELETAYSLTVDDQYIAELYFYQSANVATLYVDTISGSMYGVHKDKTYSEQASVKLYTAEGILDVSDSTAYIRGRGNATWYYGKRPYMVTLSSAADVLGMGAATKWILLANAADPTNLNNKLVFDLARQTGQGWAPECKYVDVYLNGEYSGLYLLTEKVEVGTSRLDIDPQSGDFLCKVDLERRWHSLKNPIKTQNGRTVEISSPESLTDLSRTNIVAAIGQMEQIILSGSDLSAIENFDLDSWVQRYLLDEISGNIDSDAVSSYFYRSGGVFYAGPLWDYDMSFGNNLRNVSSTAFLAKNTYKSDGAISLYYTALYANESFYNRMVERYQSEFLPLLNQLTEHGISDLAAEIQSAATMNYLCCYGETQSRDDGTVYTVDGLISYLKNRVAFLNSVWLEGTEYCTIQIKPADQDQYMNFSVRKGDLLVTDYLDLENTVWVDDATGTVVDFSQPVMSDMIVTQQYAPNGRHDLWDRDSVNRYVMILSIFLLLAFLFYMTYTDISQRRKERRAANETKKTHVSP